MAIIGGGIIGLATAYQLTQRFPRLRIIILEKEDRPALHQTGHNSGVLHSGIYYKPGSLKAINCREGKIAMENFCDTEGIEYDICGKIIVAINEKELPALENIYQRGQENGIQCEVIDQDRLRELEPHAAGIRAIQVKDTGIIDYKQVCQRLDQRIKEKEENEILYSAKVVAIHHRNNHIILDSKAGEIDARYVVNCTGLHSDRMTKLSGQKPEVKIIPFRGEYYELIPSAYHLCRNLIYPVPDPAFPFLGVHFTRMIDGTVECGPNAVLAFAREGYTKYQVNAVDLFESLTYFGFIKLSLKYWRVGAGEIWRSVSKAAFVRALQRLIPEIKSSDLKPAPAGVRAQAITPAGAMVDDFMILDTERIVNVCNAPSPAATASLNIGKHIVEILAKRF